MMRLVDFVRERGTLMQDFQRLYQCRLILRKAAPVYPELAPLLAHTERVMTRLGRWAKHELKRRRQ
jgi:hypothetical protein